MATKILKDIITLGGISKIEESAKKFEKLQNEYNKLAKEYKEYCAQIKPLTNDINEFKQLLSLEAKKLQSVYVKIDAEKTANIMKLNSILRNPNDFLNELDASSIFYCVANIAKGSSLLLPGKAHKGASQYEKASKELQQTNKKLKEALSSKLTSQEMKAKQKEFAKQKAMLLALDEEFNTCLVKLCNETAETISQMIDARKK